MDRFERKSSGTLELTIKSGGVLVDASGDVRIDVYDGAGTKLVDNVVATKVPDVLGTYRFALTPVHLSTLDVFEAVWKYRLTAAGDLHERPRRFRTVGQFYCTLSELRDFGANKTLTDPTEYSDATLTNYRELAEELLERETGDAFAPLGGRFTLSGRGRTDLFVPVRSARRVVSGTVEGIAITAGVLADLVVHRDRVLHPESWLLGQRNVALHLEYGWDAPPEEIREATMHIVRWRAESRTEQDERATSLVNDAGSQRLETGGPTGIPYVDDVIGRFSPDGDEVGMIPVGGLDA